MSLDVKQLVDVPHERPDRGTLPTAMAATLSA
jgi:hypothetical protein